MSIRPDFTVDQRQQLAKRGVLPEQVEQLRYALVEVKRVLRPPPGRTATAKILMDVTKHADALAVLLADMWNQTDAAHAAAMVEIEERYWKSRPDDIGPSSADNVIPRLDALADAAREAIASMPRDQARHRAASGKPIMWIDHALLEGWIRAQGPREVRVIDGMEFKAALPPYPDEFHPHESEQFIGIAAVCYEAAGAPRDYEPLAAIRAYVRERKSQDDELLSGFTEAIRTATPGSTLRQSARRGSRQ